MCVNISGTDSAGYACCLCRCAHACGSSAHAPLGVLSSSAGHCSRPCWQGTPRCAGFRCTPGAHRCSAKTLSVLRAGEHRGGRDGLEALQAELCVFLVCEVKSMGGTHFQLKPAFFGALSDARGAKSGLLPPLLCLDAISRAGNG